MLGDTQDNDGFWDPPADDNYNPGGAQPHPNDEPVPDGVAEPAPAPRPEQSNQPGPTGAVPPPPTTPPPGPGPATHPSPTSAPGDSKSTYKPGAFTPSPFITPNGMVPPGLPFSPDPHAVQLQNQALEKAMTPAVQPFVNPYQGAQDQLINKFLTEPQFDQNYINQQNEQQKEIALAREQMARRQMLQGSANRGTMAGGQVQAGMRRIGDDTSQQLLQSNRDINMHAQEANRGGFERALGISDQMAGGMADRLFRTDSTNRQALLDAISASESVYGGREDRGMNVAKLMEQIRMFDNDLKEKQAEFGANNQFGYDTLNTNNRFNYDQLNSLSERDWLSYLARLAGR